MDSNKQWTEWQLRQNFSLEQFWQMMYCLYDAFEIQDSQHLHCMIWWCRLNDLGVYKEQAVEYKIMHPTFAKEYALCYKLINWYNLRITCPEEVDEKNVRMFDGRILYFFTGYSSLNFMKQFWRYFCEVYYDYTNNPLKQKTAPKGMIKIFNYLQLKGDEIHRDLAQYC